MAEDEAGCPGWIWGESGVLPRHQRAAVVSLGWQKAAAVFLPSLIRLVAILSAFGSEIGCPGAAAMKAVNLPTAVKAARLYWTKSELDGHLECWPWLHQTFCDISFCHQIGLAWEFHLVAQHSGPSGK